MSRATSYEGGSVCTRGDYVYVFVGISEQAENVNATFLQKTLDSVGFILAT